MRSNFYTSISFLIYLRRKKVKALKLKPTIGLHDSTDQPGVDSLTVSFSLNEFQYSIRHLV